MTKSSTSPGRRRGDGPDKPAGPGDRHLAAEIGALLARTRRQVFQQARRHLESLGESIFVWRLLAYLHDEGPSIQAELADATAQHPASVSRLLDEVESQGLVRRHRDAEDRRRVLVELTPAGREKYLKLKDEAISVVEAALAGLTIEEQEVLAGLLAKMILRPSAGPSSEGR